MPDTEGLLPRFRAAHTQVLGVSIDSVHCHANWAASLGGVSFPLLSDFNPKGAVAASFGLYLAGAGITDRATVIIDAAGVVQHISSVTPAGSRDIGALAALCEQVDAAWAGDPLPEMGAGEGVTGATLYIKSRCGFSLRALNARANLHLEGAVAVRNISDDPEAAARLEALAGKLQVPCLVVGDDFMHESDDIVRRLAGLAAPV